MRISARIRSYPVVIDSRLYLFWPVFFEKQIAGVDVLSNSAMQDAKEAQIEYDEYLDYLLHYEYAGPMVHIWLVSGRMLFICCRMGRRIGPRHIADLGSQKSR